MRHRQVKIAMVTCGLLMLAACSSSSKSTSPTSTGGAGGGSAAGTPLKVVTIQDTTSNLGDDSIAGIKAAIGAVNAAGGVDGHPIQLTTCTDPGDPNVATTCARNAITDSKVLAVINTDTEYGTQIDPLFAQAGLASVGNSPYTAGDFTCTVCFALNPSSFSSVGAAVAAIKLLNAKRIGVPYVNIPGGAGLAPLVDSVIGPMGGHTVGVIPVDLSATDLTPQAAAEGAAHPDVIIDGLTTALFSEFIHAYRSQGFTTPILPAGGVYDVNGIRTQLAGVNNNIYIVSGYNYQSAGYQQFLKDKQQYNASYPTTNDTVVQGWASIKLFAYAAQHASAMTRQAILAELKSLNAYDTNGLLPPLNFATPQTAFGGHAPAIYDDVVYLYKYNNGKLDPVGSNSAINVFTGNLTS